MLADARKKLAQPQEAVRSGNESNYAKVLERLKPYQDTIEVHEKTSKTLKRELTNLSRSSNSAPRFQASNCLPPRS